MQLNINNQELLLEKFEKWWYQEGIGFQQKKDEDIEEFVKRITEISWLNGAYIYENHILKGDTNE